MRRNTREDAAATMTETDREPGTAEGTLQAAETWQRIAERSQRIVQRFLTRHAGEETPFGDPANRVGAFAEMTGRLFADPARLMQAQMDLWQSHMRLWTNTAERLLGSRRPEPVAAPQPEDRRFRDQAWEENAVFDYIKQSYLVTARWLQSTVRGVEGLDDKTARKVDFYTRQFVDAMAPTNFVLTNPEVLRETVDSKGENLVRGLENLLHDLERGDGELRISMTDMAAFEVGKNVAVTPGEVVFRNDMIELIQYAPTTATVHKRPLLVVPPWINKFYILDLRPRNSFVKWATDQGYTVFVISWVNPDRKLAEKTFDDYMLEGPIAALDAIEQATGEREVCAASLCLGGTLLACTLAYLAAIGDTRIKSATLMASLVDFSEPGELGVFIDDEQLAALETRMRQKGGYLDGGAMSTTFNMLRANDLIWSFVINNYLLGKEPLPFDLLYWNADSTRMPARMHSFYLRNMYQNNRLIQPGGIELAGEKIDLGKVKTPVYVLATREDHIAPWRSAYAAVHLFAGPVRFVLGGSGHIAGITNAPAVAKYPYWTNRRKPKSPDAWLDSASAHQGSWWTDWDKWQARHAGPLVPARTPGTGRLASLGPAPGAYVLQKEK